MPLAWSAKLQRTAGTCSFRTVGGTQRTAAIELSEKVLGCTSSNPDPTPTPSPSPNPTQPYPTPNPALTSALTVTVPQTLPLPLTRC